MACSSVGTLSPKGEVVVEHARQRISRGRAQVDSGDAAEEFDLSDTFDFSDHLASLGMAHVGEFLGEADVIPRHLTTPTVADRWRTWVKQTFSADESGLVLGMFAGDKKSVSSDVQNALRRLGLSPCLRSVGTTSLWCLWCFSC